MSAAPSSSAIGRPLTAVPVGNVTPIAKLLGRRYVLKIVGDTIWETARNAGSTALDIDALLLFERESGQRFIPAENGEVAHERIAITSHR